MNKLNKDIVLTWQMNCCECKFKFEVKVPKGPSEEKALRCPQCGSKNIQRAEETSTTPAQCGG